MPEQFFERTRNPPKSYDFVVVVRTCTECSIGCLFCGFSRDIQRSRKFIDSATLRLLGESLQAHQVACNQQILVTWLGGEPFQWPNWRTATRAFVEDFKLDVSLTTNGLSLAAPHIRGDALRWFCQITISIDGFAKYHDLIRQAPGMHRRLKEILTAIQAERTASTPWLRVNTILTRHNIEQFGDFCSLMAEWGFDELTFNPLGGNDRPEFYPANRLTIEQILRFQESLPKIRRQAAEQGLSIRGSSAYLHRLLATASHQLIAIQDCLPGTRFLFVDEMGQMSPCSFTSHPLGISVEWLRSHSIAELPQVFRSSRSLSMPSPCSDCHATHQFEKFAP